VSVSVTEKARIDALQPGRRLSDDASLDESAYGRAVFCCVTTSIDLGL